MLASADGVTVCEPRRNRWIAQEGEKDDPLDAAKVAPLQRGGYLKAVHHPESEARSILQGHVSVDHDRVRQRVRTAHRIIAQWRVPKSATRRLKWMILSAAEFLQPA